MTKNIYKILLESKRVNHYTKLLIMLNTYNHFKDYYIPNKKLKNLLGIENNRIRDLLYQLENENIIKIFYKGKKRFFKFIDIEDKHETDIFHYDWLNDDE